jgi:predicted transcriptional regulator
MSEKQIVRAKDVMKPNLALVDGLITVKEALQVFRDTGAAVLIVNKRHENDEYGLVLLSDIAKQVVAKDRSPERVNIYEIMAKPVVAVDPNMDIRYCARLFDNFGLALAPVVDGGEVKGVVSYRDIVLDGLI